MKRLPDTELEVMKALWDSGPDTPRAALERALAPHGWAANTINTYLTRLADKGFLSARRLGRSNRYTPLVSREDYLSFDSRSVLSRLYSSSPRNFVAALARDGLAPGEVAEPLVEAVAEDLRGRGLEVATGRFGADMKIDMEADGPVTILIEVE